MRTSMVLALSLILIFLAGCSQEPSEDLAEPSEVPAAVTKERPTPPGDPAIEAAILAAIPDYTREVVEIGGGRKARYLYVRADLDDDGADEVIVYLLGSYFCGTGGCNLLILAEAVDGYRVVNNFPTSGLPLVASRDTANGWSDLVRKVSGGGAPTEYVVHTFDGEKYVEKERLPAEAAPTGEAYLADEFAFEDGIVLEPTE